MTTEKIKPNDNWFKCSDTNRTEIQAYNRFLDENHKPVKRGGFNIEMGFTIFETWADLSINIYDREGSLKDQLVIKTALDQVIKIKPSNLSILMSDKDKKNYKHSLEMGRFHFYDFKSKTTLLNNKLWDESEINKFKKDIDDKQIDLEELIKEKEGK